MNHPGSMSEGRREARVRLLPDGCATDDGAGALTAEITERALVYISIGDREIGVDFKAEGAFDIWVHEDAESGSRRFTYNAEPVEEAPDV